MTESLTLISSESLGLPPHIGGCIELFGLCGAGKTTITDGLAPILETRERGSVVARPISPGGIRTLQHAMWLALRAIIKQPSEVSRFLSHHQGRRLFLKLGLRLASMDIRNACRRTLLIDSGILQPLVSYLVEQNIRKVTPPLRALIPVLPFPAATIYVRVNAEVAYRRYMSRQGGTEIAFDGTGLRGRFEDGFTLCEWLHDYCTAVKIPTLIVDSSDRLNADQLEKLTEKVLELS